MSENLRVNIWRDKFTSDHFWDWTFHRETYREIQWTFHREIYRESKRTLIKICLEKEFQRLTYRSLQSSIAMLIRWENFNMNDLIAAIYHKWVSKCNRHDWISTNVTAWDHKVTKSTRKQTIAVMLWIKRYNYNTSKFLYRLRIWLTVAVQHTEYFFSGKPTKWRHCNV